MQILSGHTTPETAYIVNDYPYGFRLRCKIRYWLEYKPGKGFRLVSQTTNPKRPGEVWNKPKASTYSLFGGVMLLDDNDHITWEGIHEYSNDEKVFSFLEHYGHTMPDHAQQFLAKVVATKHIYNDKQKEGLHYTIAAKVAVALTGIQAQAKGELGK